jgi:hypothetical protein
MTGVSTKTYAQEDPSQRSAFRNTWTQPEGGVGAHIIEGRIIDVNLGNWTVDFVSQFDQKFFLNVQVTSPYMNPNQGEGIYAFPEVGSKCLLCIPSDGPPPFIIGFFMPQESIGAGGNAEAPEGTGTTGGTTAAPGTNATFSGGRPRPKPGDIYMRGRDGNFCVLHRGGVLQIGATALAQRIFIPVGNIITDISQNYHHHNTAGSVNWGVSAAPSEENPPTSWKQTFRLFANQDQATVRVAVGTFEDIIGVPAGSVGLTESIAEGIGAGDSPIVCEVTISPEQIGGDDGSVGANTKKQTKLQFAFDKSGGAYLWTAGSVVLATKKKFYLLAEDDITIRSGKNVVLEAAGALRLGSKGGLTELRGDVVMIGPGQDAVAHVGSIVQITIPPGTPLSLPVASGSAALSLPLTITGIVTTGKPTVKV